MKSKKEIKAFYNSKIAPNVTELEKKISKNSNDSTFYIFAFLISFLPIFIFDLAIMIIPSILILAKLFMLSSASGKQNKEYINLVIKPLLKEISPSLKFYPDKGVSKMLVSQSRVYTGEYDKFTSKNLCKGLVDNKLVRFSNMKIKVRKRDDLVTVFDGVFMDTSMKKSIDGVVCIYPDLAEKHLGFFGKGIQKKNRSDLKKITMDSPTFEKDFIVYTNNPIQAPYILTHSMMSRIVKLQKKIKKISPYGELYSGLTITFVKNKIYLAINGYEGFSQIKKQVDGADFLSFENIEHNIDLIAFILDLSEDLNLESVA